MRNAKTETAVTAISPTAEHGPRYVCVVCLPLLQGVSHATLHSYLQQGEQTRNKTMPAAGHHASLLNTLVASSLATLHVYTYKSFETRA